MARSRLWISLFGVLLLGAACGRRTALAPGPPPALTPVAIATPLPPPERMYYDNGGGIQDMARLVVRDAQALHEVWQQATSRQTSPPPPPAVDFRREMVLVVAAGRRTPEDRIQVDSVGLGREATDVGRTAEVMTVIVRSIDGCRRFNVDAYPLEIVRVRRFDGSVNFVERRERAECQ